MIGNIIFIIFIMCITVFNLLWLYIFIQAITKNKSLLPAKEGEKNSRIYTHFKGVHYLFANEIKYQKNYPNNYFINVAAMSLLPFVIGLGFLIILICKTIAFIYPELFTR
jgi:hypothetical protein